MISRLNPAPAVDGLGFLAVITKMVGCGANASCRPPAAGRETIDAFQGAAPLMVFLSPVPGTHIQSQGVSRRQI